MKKILHLLLLINLINCSDSDDMILLTSESKRALVNNTWYFGAHEDSSHDRTVKFTEDGKH